MRGWEWRYLWGLTHSDALYTLGHKSEIESLAASLNGNWLAIGQTHNAGLKVYDIASRQEVAHLADGEGELRAAFSPGGSLLAFTSVIRPDSGNEQDTLRLWNTARRQVVSEFPLEGPCKGLAFAQDGRTLVTSTSSGHITLWRIPDGTKLATYPSKQRSGLDPATDFAANSDLSMAVYGAGTQIHVLNLDDGKELWSAIASKAYITALAFSPDGKTLASAAGFGESDIRLWKVADGTEIARLQGHKSWVASLVFWPDGKKLASSSADQTIRIWDLPSHECLDVLRGNRQEVWRLALLPDHKTLVSGSKDGAVCFWDTSFSHSHHTHITIPGIAGAWRFTPDSRSLLTLGSAGQLEQSSGPDFQTRESIFTIGTNFVGSIFSSDGRFLAAGSTKGNMSIWDVSRRALRHEFKMSDGNVAPVAFLGQGKRLLAGFPARNSFAEWDLEAGREIQSWPMPPLLNAVWVSPDDRLAIGLGWNGDVSARNLADHGATNLPLDAVEGCYGDFSPDGARLAIASSLGYARVWDTAVWREEATLQGFLNGVNSVAFSPDGKRLATGGSNPTDAVRLWDVDSWQELLTLEGVGSQFLSTGFAPDNNVLGTLSAEGILNLWRAPSWEEINAVESEDPRSPGLAPSPGHSGQDSVQGKAEFKQP